MEVGEHVVQVTIHEGPRQGLGLLLAGRGAQEEPRGGASWIAGVEYTIDKGLSTGYRARPLCKSGATLGMLPAGTAHWRSAAYTL